MKFIVRGTKYEMDDQKMTFAEARAVEKVTGHTMAEISRTGGDDVTTLQAMIWVAMKRDEPTLRFSDLDSMAMGELEFLPEDDQPAGEGDAPGPPEPADPEVSTGSG